MAGISRVHEEQVPYFQVVRTTLEIVDSAGSLWNACIYISHGGRRVPGRSAVSDHAGSEMCKECKTRSYQSVYRGQLLQATCPSYTSSCALLRGLLSFRCMDINSYRKRGAMANADCASQLLQSSGAARADQTTL